MIRERVADNVYIFTSELYAKVNAGAVVGSDYAVVIDTLAYPSETIEIKEFLETRMGKPVRYVINTHHHSDHSLGTCFFPDAIVISHAHCRTLLDTQSRAALAAAKEQNVELRDVEIVLPDVIFEDGTLSLRVGKRTLELIPLPGHSKDGIGVLVVEERALFSGDVMMPIPYIVHGKLDVLAESMKILPALKLENLVQGHGEVILRGEVEEKVEENLEYLSTIEKHVRIASRRKDPQAYLESIDVEACGKSRVLMNGLAQTLHTRNLVALYQREYGEG
ncbi:MAG: MBL fold metallo-hydrolase [Anaerolineales bacterium]|nr:MBL fold metallo-hydrolase [Anaerolineales bacterium]